MDRKEFSVIKAMPGNDKCIDCTEPFPTWASVKFGILFCLECSGKHRGLGVRTDFVRSVTLDSWTEPQLAVMKAGGNLKFSQYLEEHGAPTHVSIKEKYESEVAQHYKTIIVATVKGENVPSFPPNTGSSSNNEDSTMSISKASTLEETKRLVLTEPILTYAGVVGQVLTILFKSVLPFFINPAKFAGITLVVIGVLYSFPNNRAVQVLSVLYFSLPTFGTAFLTYTLTKKFITKRLSPFKSASNLLIERIQNGRAERKQDQYDVYFPNVTKAKKRKYGILFHPGALVNHGAYAPLASKLSDEGILVVVVSWDPYRLPDDVDIGQKKTLNAMYEVLSNSGVSVDEWVLCGHSAGSNVAIKLMTRMKPGFSKLILMGTMNAMGLGPEYSLRDSAVDVLVLNGSNDGLINKLTPPIKEKFFASLPPIEDGGKGKTIDVTINGGNHAGFGYYGPQDRDGERTITLEEQQDIISKKIIDFLS